MYHHRLCNHIKNISVIAKRINYSPYEKQVLLACVKEYDNITENKGTERRTTNEKENACEALANKYADLMPPRGARTAESLLEKVEKSTKTYMPQTRFQTGGGPPQPFQMIKSLKPFVTFSREDCYQTRMMMTRNPHDKTHSFKKSSSEFLSNKSLFGGHL